MTSFLSTAYYKTKPVKAFVSLALVLVLAMSAMLASLSVSAEETLTYGYFNYVVDDDGVCITEYTGNGGDVSIPNMIDDKSVIAIGDEAFWYRDDVTNVDLPDYLEYIGIRAFQGCSSLDAIVLPDTVIEIGDACFESCKNLKAINIPADLLYVGAFAFDDTPWITRFEDNTSIIFGGKVFYKYLGNSPVVSIPKGVTGISANAFEGNTKIEYVSIPESTLFIGDMCFLNCPKLKVISLPDELYYMGASAFGYHSTSESSETVMYDGVTIYANEGTLGADYAKEYEITLKSPADHATPDELPEAETCTVKDYISEEGEKQGLFSSGNNLAAFIIITASCVGIVGGLALVFGIREKKLSKEKKQRNEQKAKNNSSKRKKK
ncbi:MAG: leucine-rich repeat domain-containing protein [Ruminococcus sp.]